MELHDRARELALTKQVLGTCVILLGQLKIYDDGNSQIAQSLSRLRQSLDEYFRRRDCFEFAVARHGLLYEGEFLERANTGFARFASQLFMHGVATVALHRGIADAELRMLLRHFLRRPAETWEAGGIVRSLAALPLPHVEVGELSERGLQLLDEEAEGIPAGADLWERFALAQLAVDNPSPEELAGAVGNLRTPEERARLVKAFDDLLQGLQHDDVRIYRSRDLARLTSFINHLTPELRRLFLRNAFNLSLKADFAEGLLGGLSDEVILDALRNAALDRNYVPPVILGLLGRLAEQRGLAGEDTTLPPGEETDERTRELFRADEFEKYVPEQYRQALLRVVRGEKPAGTYRQRLDALLGTLEPMVLEQHLGAIILDILQREPDDRYLGGLRSGFERMLQEGLAAGNFAELHRLFTVSTAPEGSGALPRDGLRELFFAENFARNVVFAIPRAGKHKYDEIRALIVAVGPVFVGPLLDHLANEENRAVRQFCIVCLKQFGQTAVNEALRRLSDKRWFYLRNILYLLRELDDAAALPRLRPLLEHPHAKVRDEALKACLYFRDAGAERLLLADLASKERERLVNAIALAPLARGEQVVWALCDLLDRPQWFGYDLDLRRRLVQALGELGDVRALPVLQRLLEGRKLLHAASHEQLQLEVLRSLGRYPLEYARPLLERQARGGGEQARIAQALLGRGGTS